jgi:hypothetical protein
MGELSLDSVRAPKAAPIRIEEVAARKPWAVMSLEELSVTGPVRVADSTLR